MGSPLGRLKSRPVAPIILGFVSKIRGSLKFFVHVVSRGGKGMNPWGD